MAIVVVLEKFGFPPKHCWILFSAFCMSSGLCKRWEFVVLSVGQDDEVQRHTTFCRHTLEDVFTDIQSQVDSVKLSLSDLSELLHQQVRALNLIEHFKLLLSNHQCILIGIVFKRWV